MKTTNFLPLFALVILTGCSSQPTPHPSPTAHLTPQQDIEKIQNDPSVPDGLKKIQIDTIQRQAGIRSNAPGSGGSGSTTG